VENRVVAVPLCLGGEHPGARAQHATSKVSLPYRRLVLIRCRQVDTLGSHVLHLHESLATSSETGHGFAVFYYFFYVLSF
jgi:hypothetical protein